MPLKSRVKNIFVEIANIITKDASLVDEVELLNSARSVAEQIDILKSMEYYYSTLTDISTPMLFRFYTKMFCEFYLFTHPKSQVKCAIARIFTSARLQDQVVIAEILSQRLVQLMKTSLSCHDEDLMDDINNTIIFCLVDNFHIGIKALSICLANALSFLNESITYYKKKLRLNVTPAIKREICLHIHSATRAGISLLQKAQDGLALHKFRKCPDLSDELQILFAQLHHQNLNKNKFESNHLLNASEDNYHTTTKDENISQLINIMHCLYNSTLGLIVLQDIPMDTKLNCGHIIVLLQYKLDSANGWMRLVVDGINSPPEELLHNNTLDYMELSIYTGLLNTLSLSELNYCVPNSSDPVISLLFKKLLEIRNMSDSSFIIGISRAVHLLSCKLYCCCQKVFEVRNKSMQAELSLPVSSTNHITSCLDISKFISNILEEGLTFVWTHLEHFMDTVRHTAQNILQNYLKIGILLKSNGLDKLMRCMEEAIMQISHSKKSRYISLSTLGKVVKCSVLFELAPNLISDIIHAFEDSDMSPYAASTFECLMVKHHKEGCLDQWVNTWVIPLSVALQNLKPVSHISMENILAKAAGLYPNIVYNFIPKDSEWVSTNKVFTVITLCKIARRQGAYDHILHDCETKWKDFLDYNVLKEALHHEEPQIRISTFSLLVESRRSTEQFTAHEIDLLCHFLTYNITTNVPSARQDALSLFKKLLVRLRDSAQCVYRCVKQYRNKNIVHKPGEMYLQLCNSFLEWVVEFCYNNLFPGANVGRRRTTLQMLVYCQDILWHNSVEYEWIIIPTAMWSADNADKVMECIKDTYEMNKLWAYTLLLLFPEETLGFHEESYMLSLIKVSLLLASSNRPPDSITAAYLFKLIAAFPCNEEALIQILKEIVLSEEKVFELLHIEPTNHRTIYIVITILIHQLKEEAAIAAQNLRLAASNFPMYGTLLCIRYLLQNVDFKEVDKCKFWQGMIREIFTICLEVNTIVLPVVNSSSPEGHLPVPEQNEPALLHVTAQMVLLCSWRTIKEVSLFLGEVSERVPIPSFTEEQSGTDNKYLVTEQDIIMMGNGFTKLLLETKHRGAFEQAHVGFCKLCTRLWKSPSGTISNLPRQWLGELMNTILTDTGDAAKLCVTRRSAGVPFMVQALIITELQVVGHSRCLQGCMSNLLEQCAPGNSVSTEAKTRALNILRALFKNTMLGEVVMPYVAQGIVAAIKSYKGTSWPERNSAALLFSSLVTRTFGVQHSRDELSIRNCMTGRIFFHRYPQLFEFLLQELQPISANMTDFHPSLFPVLHILGRLYPSSLEGTDSNLQLNAYIPHVLKCASCSILEIRVLAAKALVPLIAPNVCISYLTTFFNEISAIGNIKENERHGLMLMIVHLLKTLPKTVFNDQEHSNSVIHNWISQTKWFLFAETFDTIPFITLNTYLQILRILVTNFFYFVPKQVWLELQNVLKSTLPSLENITFGIGKWSFEESAAEMLLFLTLILTPDVELLCIEMETLTIGLLLHKSYEVNIVCLNFILCLFDEENNFIEEISYLNLSQMLSNLNDKSLQACKTLIQTSKCIPVVLINQATSEHTQQEHKQKIFEALYHMDVITVDGPSEKLQNLIYLLDLCMSQHESVGNAVLRYVGACVHQLIEQFSEMDNFCLPISELTQVLVMFSSTEKPLLCRSTVAKFLLENSVLLEGNPYCGSALDICTLWGVVFILLEDDAIEVRQMISKLTDKLLYIYKVLNIDNDCCSCGMPVLAQKARELLMQVFVAIMSCRNPFMCVTALTAWSLWQREQPIDASEEYAGLFDKGEINIYAEDITLTKVTTKHLYTLMTLNSSHTEPLFIKELTDEMKCWFIQWSGLIEEQIPELSEIKTINDFLTCISKLTITATSEKQAGNVNVKPWHFLNPGHKLKCLLNYKLKEVIETCDLSNIY